MSKRRLIILGALVLIVGGFFLVRAPKPVIAIAPELVANIGGYEITNTILSAWVVIFLLVVGAFFVWRRTRNTEQALVPSGIQNVIEVIYEAFAGIAEQVVGARNARIFFPVIFTIFIFLLAGNWFGLFPWNNVIGQVDDTREHYLHEMELSVHDLKDDLKHGERTVSPAEIAAINTAFTNAYFDPIHFEVNEHEHADEVIAEIREHHLSESERAVRAEFAGDPLPLTLEASEVVKAIEKRLETARKQLEEDAAQRRAEAAEQWEAAAERSEAAVERLEAAAERMEAAAERSEMARERSEAAAEQSEAAELLEEARLYSEAFRLYSEAAQLDSEAAQLEDGEATTEAILYNLPLTASDAELVRADGPILTGGGFKIVPPRTLFDEPRDYSYDAFAEPLVIEPGADGSVAQACLIECEQQIGDFEPTAVPTTVNTAHIGFVLRLEEKGIDGATVGHIFPFFRAIATDVNLPLALALWSLIMVQFWGVKGVGLGANFGKYIGLGSHVVVKGPMGVFVGVLEIISEIGRVVSFTFRLFGNIFAGEVVLFISMFLVAFIVPSVFFGLEIFVGFIQAFVFAMLTLVFAGAAVAGHDDHDEESEGGAH